MNLRKELILYISVIYLTGAFILNPFYGYTQDLEKPHFEIESDPLAYLFNGYSMRYYLFRKLHYVL